MTGLNYLLEAFACHGVDHPHRKPFGNVLCKLISGQAPDSDDIAVVIQAFAMQPFLCTLDLQDAIDAINEIHGTSFSVNGRDLDETTR